MGIYYEMEHKNIKTYSTESEWKTTHTVKIFSVSWWVVKETVSDFLDWYKYAQKNYKWCQNMAHDQSHIKWSNPECWVIDY